MLVTENAQVQRRCLLETAPERVNQFRMRVELSAKCRNIPGLCRTDNRADCLRFVLRAGVDFLYIADEQFDRFVAPLLGDLVNSAAVNVGSCRIKARSEGATDCFNIPGACGFEYMFVVAECRGDGIDMRLEGTPALEAIIIGDRELGLMQLGIGLRNVQLDKPMLGGFLKPIEIGIRGQRLRHGTPSFSAPGDRNSRARKKE